MEKTNITNKKEKNSRMRVSWEMSEREESSRNSLRTRSQLTEKSISSFFASILRISLAVALILIMPVLVHAGDVSVGGSNTELQNNNEVFLSLKNTEGGGKEYALVSAGSAGGIGVGKFSIYDKTAGISRLIIDASGNVGIGTAGPLLKLHVNGESIFGSATNGVYLNYGSSVAQVRADYVGAGSYVPLTFWTSGAEKVRITTVGNVGIGTTSPNNKLQVVGNINVGPNFAPSGTAGTVNIISNDTTVKPFLNIKSATALDYGFDFDHEQKLRGELNIYSVVAGARTLAMTISRESGKVGNVGIGTASPAAKLDVSGGVKVANDMSACDASKAGTIRWTGTAFQGCTGTTWTKIAGGEGGTSQTDAGRTCKKILDDGLSTGSGIYWIDPDNDGNTNNAFQAYCDMINQDGGWTLVVGIEANANHVNTAAVTSGSLTSPTGKGKYSDTTINQIKLGASPAYRLTCASVIGYFQTSCTFAATTDASGACTAEAYTYPPVGYGTAQISQGSIKALADGTATPADRLIYGHPSLNGCDTAGTSWGQSGTLYVR
ncbi:hypothetical protein J4234_02085 [Candidatus Woesearchaeota archaeon]|nr:hypothetical protein [Candidatus Woesearchaeota archaeon]